MDRYLSTKEPYDKAGSYGIQGLGSLMVECIEGCYFNVMGLPLFRLSRMLEKEGHEVLSWLGANVV
jgi:septum formation protein